MRWWSGLPERRAETARAAEVVERLDRAVAEGLATARRVWRRGGSERTERTAAVLVRSAAMAIVAEQVAAGAGVGGGAARTGWDWLAERADEWMRVEALRALWRGVDGPAVTLLRGRGAPAVVPQGALSVARGLLARGVDEDGGGARGGGWSAEDVGWIAGRLEDEGRLQAWREGDAERPGVLLRTPRGFNRGRRGRDASPAWLRVGLATGRMEAVPGSADGGSLPFGVLAWAAGGRKPAHAGVPGTVLATGDLILALVPSAGDGVGLADAARTAARRRERNAFRVREALRAGPAAVAERVRGVPATVRDLLYLSAGHGGGRRRRALFARYRALGREALIWPPAARALPRMIGEAADRGEPVRRIVAAACGTPPPRDLAGELAAEVDDYLRKSKWSYDVGASRLRAWRNARPSSGTADEAALDALLDGGGPTESAGALLVAAPRRFAGWIAQDPVRLNALARAVDQASPARWSGDLSLQRFVRTGLAGMAWRAAGRAPLAPLQDLGDVVGMLAADLVVPRVREGGAVALALDFYNRDRSPRLTAEGVAELVVWGVTFDARTGGGGARWSALSRACRQLHRPAVLAARDGILQASDPRLAFVPPAGWTGLSPAERGGARHLATEDELAREGRRMQHCVRTYGSRVLSGWCDLFHLEGEGVCVTLEVVEQWTGGTATYRPGQIRGPGNRPASPVEEMKARRLCGAMTEAAGRLGNAARAAVRDRRARQARTPRGRPAPPCPTRSQRRRLWDDVYAERVPAPWRQLAPDRRIPWGAWVARYVGPLIGDCVRFTTSLDWERLRDFRVMMSSLHRRDDHPLDDVLRDLCRLPAPAPARRAVPSPRAGELRGRLLGVLRASVSARSAGS